LRPFKTPIETNVKGIYINELLPMLAKQADKYSLIRSMTHSVNAHETASYMMQTGHDSSDRLVYPSIGAVVSLFKDMTMAIRGYTSLYYPDNLAGTIFGVGFLGRDTDRL